MRRQIISSFFLIISGVGIIIALFTFFEVQKEEARLIDDLERRSYLVAESLRETIEPYVIAQNEVRLQQLVDRFSDRERLMGLLVYDNKDQVLASSSSITSPLTDIEKVSTDSMDGNRPSFELLRVEKGDKKLAVFSLPLLDNGSVVGALTLVHSATYIDAALFDIWRSAFIRFLSYSAIIFLSLVFILHWIFSRPMKQLIETIRKVRSGKSAGRGESSSGAFFTPIIDEFSTIQKSLLEAQNAASQEARLRLEELDSPWTAERLKEYTKDALKGKSLYVVSNREPYIHTKNGREITVVEPASGMVTALDPIMKACGGVWIAHGSGTADREVVDANNKVEVPPFDPKYSLKRVWLTSKEEKGYYYGFSNDGLWPLCHSAFVEPQFRKKDFEEYKKVNIKFAKSILSEIEGVEKPLIFIQDYHFTLLPKLIKESRPDAVIAMFWHIPWPNSETFRVCPWGEEILEGMLGADLLAFQTQLQCNNFIDTVRKQVEALVDLEQFAIQKNGHLSYVKPIPISVAFKDSYEGEVEMSEDRRNKILRNFGVSPTEFIGVGIDRMDYTKGLVERFLAIERFFEKYPAYIGRFTFIQVAPPTRLTIPSYKHFSDEVHKHLNRINSKFRKKGWNPIVMFNKQSGRQAIEDLYSLCNICLVTSLHDGMNLVAKEFVASRKDDKGVLILSQFTGASQELTQALIVNPFDIDGTADAIKIGIEMKESEQKKRMRALRKIVRTNNIYRWAAVVLKTMTRIDL